MCGSARCPELNRSSDRPLFPVRRGGDPHSTRRKRRREPRTSGNDALVAPLPTTSSHAEASLGEPRQVGCSDRDPVSEAPAPRPAHVRRGGDPGARGQRRPGLSAAGAGPRRQAGQRPGARGPGRPGRHALPGTWPSPRPRFPQAHLRGPGGQNRWGGPGRGVGPAEKPRCPPDPPRARLAPAAPGRGPGLRDGGAPPRKSPPGPYGALGAGHPTAGAPTGPSSRGPTPAAAGPRRQRLGGGRPPGGPPAPRPAPPGRPSPGVARGARARGGSSRARALFALSLALPVGRRLRQALGLRPRGEQQVPRAARRQPARPAPQHLTPLPGSASARVTPPRPPRAAPPTRRAGQRPAHSRHHPPRAPPRPGPAQRRLRPRAHLRGADTFLWRRCRARRAVAAAVPRRREPGAPPVSLELVRSQLGGRANSCLQSTSVFARWPPEPNLKRPPPPRPAHP